MEKRYQVFISPTFQDLQGARQEVSQALLRADCFPAGMELFPAADEEQFEFIKTVIDQSDYYIIISAGRYGSIHPETGLSYTEMEYDYAVETGKPVIRLLHKDPFNELKGAFLERSDNGRRGLEKFREKLTKSSLVRFWVEPMELGREVTISLLALRKRKPDGGWVPARQNIGIMDRENELLRNELRRAEYSALSISTEIKIWAPNTFEAFIRLLPYADTVGICHALHWIVIELDNARSGSGQIPNSYGELLDYIFSSRRINPDARKKIHDTFVENFLKDGFFQRKGEIFFATEKLQKQALESRFTLLVGNLKAMRPSEDQFAFFL